MALRFSSAILSSSLLFSADAASRTSLSSRSRSVIRCSFSAAFFSRSVVLWAHSSKDYHNITRSSVAFQQSIIKNSTSWATCHQRIVDGHNAGPQGLHILIVLRNVILPRGVIPVNFSPRQPRARRQRLRYLCARCSWTSWCRVNLRLVLDQVLSPSRSRTDGVDINNPCGGRRSDIPSRSSSSRFNSSTHPRQNKAHAKSTTHQNKARKTTKISPCTHASSP
jgi:hypothetical protein